MVPSCKCVALFAGCVRLFVFTPRNRAWFVYPQEKAPRCMYNAERSVVAEGDDYNC